MTERKFSCILLLLLTSCAMANEPPQVIINNQLKACVNISVPEVSAQGSIPTVSFDLNINKPISECGCKSALGSFRVFSSTEGYKSYLLSGKVALVKPERKVLPLSAAQNLVKSGKLEIDFSCALPD